MFKNKVLAIFILLNFLVIQVLQAASTGTCYDLADTVLMDHMNGSNAGTTFTDSATGKTATVVGNAQTATDQVKFGSAAYKSDGVGDGITYADSADFDFPGDFTIDCWIRFDTAVLSKAIFDKEYSNASGYLVEPTSINTVIFYNNNTNTIQRNFTFSADTWYHFAIIRTGSTVRMFIDGTQIGADATFSTSLSGSTGVFAIGLDATDGNILSFNGWIDEFRVVKGTAVWTSNFTRPSAEYVACGGNTRNLTLLGAGQ